MYYDKLGMHVPPHFELPGNTTFFSAWKLCLNRNPGYRCTNVGVEKITAPICQFKNFTVASICKKLRKNFNTGWKKILMMMDSATGNECVMYALAMVIIKTSMCCC